MALIKCPECLGDVSDKAPACIHCGYPLRNNEKDQTIYCPYCGKENVADNDFCPYCGKSFLNNNIIEKERSRDTEIQVIESMDVMDFTTTKKAEQKTEDIAYLVATQLAQQQLQVEQQIQQNNNQAKCPLCSSTSLIAEKKGFGYGKAVAGAVLLGGIGILAGGIGANKTMIVCMNCGHKFNL